jgi:hypothetical protein
MLLHSAESVGRGAAMYLHHLRFEGTIDDLHKRLVAAEINLPSPVMFLRGTEKFFRMVVPRELPPAQRMRCRRHALSFQHSQNIRFRSVSGIFPRERREHNRSDALGHARTDHETFSVREFHDPITDHRGNLQRCVSAATLLL